MRSDIKELNKFFFSPIFIIPISIIFILEIFLRTGIYNSILKPLSYTANIIRIQNIIKKSEIDPNILIVGTSVPYQGILVPFLNEESKRLNKPYVFQSIATQAAYLVTQTTLLEYTLEYKKNIKYIIHFADMDFPWQERYDLEIANRSMLAQFDLNHTLSLLNQFEYRLKGEDYRFFYIKILTYQNDLRDFLLNPYNRIKSLFRFKKNFDVNYAFTNNNYYSLASYGNTVEECIQNSSIGINYYKNNQQITDEPHRTAVLSTCKMAGYDPSLEAGRYTWENLFIKRLNNLYQNILSKNIKLITILPPYSIFMEKARKEEKAKFWKETIKNIDPEIHIIDHRFVLDDSENLYYFYDTIHLNRMGAEKYTQIFFKDIQKYLSF